MASPTTRTISATRSDAGSWKTRAQAKGDHVVHVLKDEAGVGEEAWVRTVETEREERRDLREIAKTRTRRTRTNETDRERAGRESDEGEGEEGREVMDVDGGVTEKTQRVLACKYGCGYTTPHSRDCLDTSGHIREKGHMCALTLGVVHALHEALIWEDMCAHTRERGPMFVYTRFGDRSKLQRHIYTHTGERKYKCPFDGCDWSSAQQGNLKRHLRTQTGERPHSCPYPGCGANSAH